MNDDLPDRGDSSGAITQFEEWLEQHAKSQGVTREELFERLVSSYWTLSELVRLLEDSDDATSLTDIYPDDSEGGDAAGVATIGGDRAEAEDDRVSPRTRRKRDRTGRSHSADRDRIEALEDRLEDLQDRIDGLESDIDDEQERGQSQDGLIEALADQICEIESELDAISTDSESARESLAADLEALEGRLDGLETDVDSRHRQFAAGQRRITSRLDSEFDNLETILDYLVSRSDELDAGLATVEERHDEELSQLQWERDAMRSLMRTADAHDAHAGECEVCGEIVNLDLLVEPYCSGCSALLTGIKERSRWLIFSDTIITTEEARKDAGDGRTAPPSRSDVPEAESGVDPTAEPPSPVGGSDPDADRQSPNPGTAEHTADSSPPEDSREPSSQLTADRADTKPAPEPESASDDAPESGRNDPLDLGTWTFGPDANSDSAGEPRLAEDSGADTEGTNVSAADTDTPLGDLDNLKQHEELDEE